MSRSMIEANASVFNKIIAYVNENRPEAGIVGAKRYISTTVEEKQWLKDLEFEGTKLISFSTRSALLSYREATYFIFVGWTGLSVDNDELEEVELSAGIFTAVVAEGDIVQVKKGISPDELIQNILGLHEDEKYKGHSAEDLIAYFQPFAMYRVKGDSPLLSGGLDRITAFFLATNSTHLALAFSPQTISNFQRLCLEGSSGLDYSTTVACLSAVSWDYAFLSLYRPIERLFSLPRILDLKEKVAPTVSVLEFSAEIERCTGWRPKEDDSLELLLSRAGMETLLAPIKEVYKAISGEGAENIASFVYKVRNSIVHFRPATQPFIADDFNWDKLLGGLCDVINDLYTFYAAHLLITPPAKPVPVEVTVSEKDVVATVPSILRLPVDAPQSPSLLQRLLRRLFKSLPCL